MPVQISSFLDLRNVFNMFRLFSRDFRLFLFFFPGSACFSSVASPRNMPSWVKYCGKFESFWKRISVERVMDIFRFCSTIKKLPYRRNPIRGWSAPRVVSLRWGWVFLERTRILSGIQFTMHFIEFFVVETKWFVGSTVNVILTRQTCGQRSSKAAESKRQALGNYLSRRICYMFLVSKCRGDWDLGLCTTPGLASGELQRSGDFRKKTCFDAGKIGICYCAAVLQTQVPKLCTDLDLGLLYILIFGTYIANSPGK